MESRQRSTPTANRQLLTPGLMVAFASTVVVVSATHLIGLGNLRGVYETTEALAQTFEVKADLGELRAALADAEAGVRGFVISGERAYLEPYDRARSRIPVAIERLRRLTDENREQQEDVDRLSAAAERSLGELADVAQRPHDTGFVARRRLIDDVQNIVSRMEAREDALLAARSARATASYRSARLTRYASTGLSFLVLAVLFAGTRRFAVERRRVIETAEELRAARADVERASRLKDEFLAVLSHELRTPLNAVLGYAHLLAAGVLPPDRATHALDAIQRNARAQARLVESLLDLSRVIAGKLHLDVAEIDLSKVIGAAVDVVRPEAEAKGIRLEVNVPDDPIPVVGDAGRLEQVLWNLLSNAIKFTPNGGRVRVRAVCKDLHVSVEVADTGRGIPAEFLPHVFDRFKQADNHGTGPAAGLGLGLAVARELVQAHGGDLLAESLGEEQGSTFRVVLPLMAESARPFDAIPNRAGATRSVN